MTTQIIIIIIVLLATIIIGTPVAFAIGFTTIVTITIFMQPLQLAQLVSILYRQTTNINQLVIPLFVLMAELLARGDVATDIFNTLSRWVRRLKGGLAIGATLASTIFAALCGSSPATAAAIGRISVKQMVDRKYRGSFAAGTVAAGGTLGIMIPPSIAFITYGIITETSIVKLLIAGLIPGLMIAALLCVFIIIRARINPALVGEYSKNELAAKSAEERKAIEQANQELHGGGNVTKDAKLLIPPVVLILIVLGTMYSGVATPTESAAFGCIGALIIIVFLKRFSKKLFSDVMANTMKTACMIIFLLMCGLCLSYALSYLKIPQQLAAMIINAGLSPWSVMILMYVLWFALGAFMDPGSMIVLTIPFVFPALTALGFDPIWVGVVSTLCVEVGMITPPVGLNLFVLKSVSDVPMKDIILGALPFVLVLVVALVILSVFPQISLFLPSRV